MRSLVLIVSLLLATGGFAQVTTSEGNESGQNNREMAATQNNGDISYYTLEDQEFKFIPNGDNFHIMKIENGQEVDYGTLKLTGSDNYYTMTSVMDDDVCYGSFDENGNFVADRFDAASGEVTEEKYTKSSRTGD